MENTAAYDLMNKTKQAFFRGRTKITLLPKKEGRSLQLGQVRTFSSNYKTRPNSRPGGDFVPKKISDPPKLPTRLGFLSKINWRPGPIKANSRRNVYNLKGVLKGQMVNVTHLT